MLFAKKNSILALSSLDFNIYVRPYFWLKSSLLSLKKKYIINKNVNASLYMYYTNTI